ncbi:MAG: DUF1540 domain-containing protein [Bacillota bacterium]|nr:DUF1540 domain-containing protein [Negativicutes bacterium]
MNSPAVKCAVNTCTHYVEGDYCSAAVIHVWHQQEGRMSKSTSETQCKSYHKNEGLDALGAVHNMNVDALDRGSGFEPGVQCIVSTCKYWEEGDSCGAREIKISGGRADECEDTDCHTFAYSGAQKASTRPRV